MKKIIKSFLNFCSWVFFTIGVLTTLLGSYIAWKDWMSSNKCAAEELAPVMIQLGLLPFIFIGASCIFGSLFMGVAYLIFLLSESNLAIKVKSKTIDKIPEFIKEYISNGFIIVMVLLLLMCLIGMGSLLCNSIDAIMWLIHHDFCL
jgi:hypothetical protein